MRSHWWSDRHASRAATAVLALSTLLGGFPVGAAAAGWATGGRLQQRLAEPVSLVWVGSPLRSALRGLSRAHRVAILIDRRVDPGQELALQVDDLPLERALRRVAEDRKLGVSLFGPAAYFGPAEVAARLRTIAALRTGEIRRLPPTSRQTFLRTAPLAWHDFAVPRELLAKLAAENSLAIRGLERVPHDLWAAAELPPLSLVDRLTLIAVQFDLTFQVASDGRTISLVPVPEDVALVRSYPGGPDPQATARRYAALAPDARIKVVREKVYVKGLLEAHERIASGGRPSQPADTQQADTGQPGPPDIGRTRIDRLSVREMPVGKLLEHLAERLHLELSIQRAALQQAGLSLERPVTVRLENATVDELLREVTAAAGLRFRRRGTSVEILPGE